MSVLVVTLGENVWKLDEDALTLKDAFAIKNATGLALKPFLQGISDMDPVALAGLVWFLRFKAGEHVAFESIDFAISELSLEQESRPPVAAVVTPSPDAATA